MASSSVAAGVHIAFQSLCPADYSCLGAQKTDVKSVASAGGIQPLQGRRIQARGREGFSCSVRPMDVARPLHVNSIELFSSNDSLKNGGCKFVLRGRLPRVSEYAKRQGVQVRAQGSNDGATGKQPAGSSRNGKDERSVVLYGKIEKVFEETARRSQGTDGSTGDWEEVERSWVLRPPGTDPAKAVVHFIGGAFVGASPQLTYRLFLEELASRGFLIIATPYGSGFDHCRISDEAQFKFDRCLRKLKDGSPQLASLPVYGIGHSLGALAHLLIGARYAVERQGNVLISFNNKAASMAIPSFSPVVAPLAKQWGPLIQQLSTNPAFKFGAERAIDQIRASSPVLLRQILPLLEQLPPLAQELADGKDEFSPSPDETKKLVRAYYGVGRNLLVQFDRDSIDETPELARTLGEGAACTPFLDMQVRTLPGDHARPLQQLVPELPSEISDAAARGSEILTNLAGLAGPSSPFSDLAKGVGAALKSGVQSGQLRDGTRDDIRLLVDEVAAWLGAEHSRRGAYLPGSTVN